MSFYYIEHIYKIKGIRLQVRLDGERIAFQLNAVDFNSSYKLIHNEGITN